MSSLFRLGVSWPSTLRPSGVSEAGSTHPNREPFPPSTRELKLVPFVCSPWEHSLAGPRTTNVAQDVLDGFGSRERCWSSRGERGPPIPCSCVSLFFAPVGDASPGDGVAPFAVQS